MGLEFENSARKSSGFVSKKSNDILKKSQQAFKDVLALEQDEITRHESQKQLYNDQTLDKYTEEPLDEGNSDYDENKFMSQAHSKIDITIE